MRRLSEVVNDIHDARQTARENAHETVHDQLFELLEDLARTTSGAVDSLFSLLKDGVAAGADIFHRTPLATANGATESRTPPSVGDHADHRAPLAIEFTLSFATQLVLALDDSTVTTDERAPRAPIHCRIVVPAAYQGSPSVVHLGVFYQDKNELGEAVWAELREGNSRVPVIGGLRLHRSRVVTLAFRALVFGLGLERITAENPHTLAARTAAGAVILNLGTV